MRSLSALVTQVKNVCEKINLLYQLCSVIHVNHQDNHIKIQVDKSISLVIQGHAVTYAQGHIIRQAAKVVHDQPGIDEHDLSTPLFTVLRAYHLHDEAMKRIASIPDARQSELQLLTDIGTTRNDATCQHCIPT